MKMSRDKRMAKKKTTRQASDHHQQQQQQQIAVLVVKKDTQQKVQEPRKVTLGKAAIERNNKRYAPSKKRTNLPIIQPSSRTLSRKS